MIDTSAETFAKAAMEAKPPVYLLHQIGDRKHGANFNTIEEILALPPDVHLTFDGIYESTFQSIQVLKGRKITLFVCGYYLGRDNSFDKGQPLSNFCTLEQLLNLAEFLNASIGYHGWMHRDVRQLNEAELLLELAPPAWITCKEFAWPYGDFDQRAIDTAEKFGYRRAWSVGQGDDSNEFALKRRHLNW